jgi:hypothetical protein
LSSDLQIYFYNFTPVAGIWAGTISAKIDIDDGGFKGPGNYIVKLAKYITSSSPAYSSNSFSIAANITPTPTPAPTSTSTPTPTKTPTPTNTPVPIFSISPSGAENTLGDSSQEADLISETATPSPEISEEPVNSNSAKVLGVETGNLSKVLISLGALLLGSSGGILAFRAYGKHKKMKI